MYKAHHNLIAVDSHKYLIPTPRDTRQSHSITFIPISAVPHYYRYSFYPHTIFLWNSLPARIAEAPNVAQFKVGLAAHTVPPNLI